MGRIYHRGSGRWSLPSGDDWLSLGKGLLIALAGAAATYLQVQGADWLGLHVPDALQALAFAVNSFAVNWLRKWATDTDIQV